MNYKGCTARFEVEESDGTFHGRAGGIRGPVTFEADNVEDLEREFRISVDVYLDWCAGRGKTPDPPPAQSNACHLVNTSAHQTTPTGPLS